MKNKQTFRQYWIGYWIESSIRWFDLAISHVAQSEDVAFRIHRYDEALQMAFDPSTTMDLY